MADEFKYDVFLSHSAKEKAAVVRPLAERLREATIAFPYHRRALLR